MSHRDTVFAPPPGFTRAGLVERVAGGGLRVRGAGVYGIQFHPEVVHTPYGQDVLKRFLGDVCGCDMAWSAASIVEDQIARIRDQVGDAKVICGLSGGVDSSVAALLVHRAIGDQLTCVFVDHGLMRKNEGEQVISAFRDTFKVPLVAVDAETRFLDKLRGVTEPERKRKIIGAEFIRVFEEEAAKIGDARFLVQGTLYSDVIESGGGTGAATIKSHHNVGGLPDDLQFELVEPLRALFKDEVRAVGAELGLPERLVWRQPFPGPGLAIRVVGGEATKERLDVLRDADFILQDEIRNAGLYRELWQSFCVLPDVRTVGVQGDERTYGYVVVIRAVTSDDAMTADWARLPYDLLEQIAARMIGELREVNRVVLDITVQAARAPSSGSSLRRHGLRPPSPVAARVGRRRAGGLRRPLAGGRRAPRPDRRARRGAQLPRALLPRGAGQADPARAASPRPRGRHPERPRAGDAGRRGPRGRSRRRRLRLRRRAALLRGHRRRAAGLHLRDPAAQALDATVGAMDYQFERREPVEASPGQAQPKYEKLVMRDGRFYLQGTLPTGEPFSVQLGPSDASSEPPPR